MNYPYIIRNCGTSNVKSVYPLNNIIDYFDITTVYSGTMHYNIDGNEYILKKGDAIIIPPGSHRIRYATDSHAHYFSINYYSDGSEEAGLPSVVSNCDINLHDTITYILKVHSDCKSPRYEHKCSLAVHLLVLAIKDVADNMHLSPQVRHILQYISENITKPITLEEIGNSVFLSPQYCCNLVKKELNTTIHKIISHEKILLAQNHLIAGEVPLQQIPELCGFNDYNSFYKCFKKHTGVSPLSFRKK